MKKILLIALGMAGALNLYAAQAVSKERSSEDVVVTVEGKKITHGEIMQGVQMNLMQMSKRAPSQQLSQMREQLYQNVTDTLVANILLTKDAEKSSLAISDDELAKEIATIESKAPKGTSLKDALAENKIDYDEWKTDLRKQLLVRKLIEEKTADVAATSAAEITKFYEENGDSFKREQGGIRPLAEVKDQIREYLTGKKKQEILLAYIDELKKTAAIDTAIEYHQNQPSNPPSLSVTALQEQSKSSVPKQMALPAEQPKDVFGEAIDLCKSGRVEGAIMLSKNATEETPNDPNVWLAYGTALAADGQFAEGSKAMLKAAKTIRNSNPTMGGMSVQGIDKAIEAKAWLFEGMAEKIDKAPTPEIADHVRKGCLYLESCVSDIKTAESHFNDALRLAEAGGFSDAATVYKGILDSLPMRPEYKKAGSAPKQTRDLDNSDGTVSPITAGAVQGSTTEQGKLKQEKVAAETEKKNTPPGVTTETLTREQIRNLPPGTVLHPVGGGTIETRGDSVKLTYP